MDPTTVCCPHVACPARGHTGQGHMRLHARKDQRFHGTECRTPFTTTTGPAFYRLRTSAETVSPRDHAPGARLSAARARRRLWVRCADGGSVGARAGRQGQAVQAHLVEHPRDRGQVPADEIRIKTRAPSCGWRWR